VIVVEADGVAIRRKEDESLWNRRYFERGDHLSEETLAELSPEHVAIAIREGSLREVAD
jgi:hypothetical protein